MRASRNRIARAFIEHWKTPPIGETPITSIAQGVDICMQEEFKHTIVHRKPLFDAQYMAVILVMRDYAETELGKVVYGTN